MTQFTPSSVNAVPPILPRNGDTQTPLGRRLFRHYRSRPEGVNVFYLSDGTVTESDPDGTHVVWSANDRTGTSINAKYVVTAWYGGHDDYDVTPAEAAALVAAGYTLH